MDERNDAYRARMPAPDRHGHSADTDRDRVAAEGAEVQRLDRNALIEAEIFQAAGFAVVERVPVDLRNERLRPKLKLVETNRFRLEWRVHSCD